MDKIVTVGELIRELSKEDPTECVVIGDDDKYGRNDTHIVKIIHKKYGFDEGNRSYVTLVGGAICGNGCIKY